MFIIIIIIIIMIIIVLVMGKVKILQKRNVVLDHMTS